MLLIMLLSTCQSNKIEYVDKPFVPALSFPPFPDSAEWATRNKKERSVTVPEDWYVQIDAFRIRYEELQDNYNGLKALYENNGGNE